MIDYILGTIVHTGEDGVVIENNGIGYKLYTSKQSLSEFTKGHDTMAHIYMAVRDDDISLYGFYTEKELEFFKLLITVTTIGPRNALSILSSLSTSQIALAIRTNDIDLLTKAKGVGKKTASRIILELSDKVEGFELSDDLHFEVDDEIEAAIEALTSLGYGRGDVVKVMGGLDTSVAIEDLIKAALQRLSK